MSGPLHVVSPKRKLCAAGVVLAAGLCLATAFPRDDRPVLSASTAGEPAPNDAVAALSETLRRPVDLHGQYAPPTTVAATSAGLRISGDDSALQESPAGDLATVASDPLEVQSSNSREETYRVHVIHNGDTLERLAERYLGDPARAFELFDLNRDVLENPHILPIGAELKVPGLRPGVD